MRRDAPKDNFGSSGKPITHPVAVSFELWKCIWNMEAITGSLLHDVIERYPYTESQLKDEFGASW